MEKIDLSSSSGLTIKDVSQFFIQHIKLCILVMILFYLFTLVSMIYLFCIHVKHIQENIK